MHTAFTPIAFLAGTAALMLSVPALTDPSAHTPAAAEARADYSSEYREHHAGHEYRYSEAACAAGGEAALGAASISLLGEARTGARPGSDFSPCDRSQFAAAAQMAFDSNEPAYWSNPETGNRGVVAAGAPLGGYAHECRRAEADVFTPRGVDSHQTVTLCRGADGDWTPMG